jgi:hypothetical protein
MGYRNLTAIVEVDGVIPAPNSSVQENTSNYDGLIEFREKRSTNVNFSLASGSNSEIDYLVSRAEI